MSCSRICRVFAMVSLSSVALLFASSCEKKIQKKPFIPTVTVFRAQLDELTQMTNVVGQVSPIEKVQLRARVQGYLTQRNFEAGSFVKKGQILFQIQKDQYKADLELAVAKDIEAQAQLDYAGIEYNRYKLLLKQNASSQEVFDSTTKDKYMYDGALREAKANVALADLDLSYTDIAAPFDGRIGMYNYSVGDLVDLSSNSLAEVIMVNPIWIEFNYSEAVFLKRMQQLDNKALPSLAHPNIDTSDKVYVRLVLADGTKYPIDGKINFIDNKVDTETGTIKMKAIFENPNQLLIPGSYVQVEIGLRQKVSEIVIPQSALQSDQQGNFVFLVNSKDVIEKKYISTGIAVGTKITVTSGLQSGDIVVSQGLLLVRPGSTVKYIFQGDTTAALKPQTPSTAADTSKSVKN